ncbi:uncharacterized protein LOC142590128 isoform X4 [Dermacentor variabilis]|uniref:uncharacterized protein LOC142590128 isoform X4 n=1 Tax=Dermacentor variabilis TaxID=34621 RepID=UPI003F5B08F1
MHPTCVTLARRQQALTVPIAESTPGVYSKPIEIHGCAHFSQCILLRVTLRRRQEASASCVVPLVRLAVLRKRCA